jgi:hypothetical protein
MSDQLTDNDKTVLKGMRKLWDCGTEQEVHEVFENLEAQVGKPMTFIDKASVLLNSLATLKVDRIGGQYHKAAEAESDLIALFLQAKGAENEVV